MRALLVLAATLATMLAATPSSAQKIIDGQPPLATGVSTPPSVGDGIANGVVKRPGAPSVGDGQANGVVKSPGAPSVGNGVANGVVKSSTVNQ